MASISMNLADYAAMTFYANGGMERINAFKAQIGLTPTLLDGWGVGETTGCTALCGCGQMANGGGWDASSETTNMDCSESSS